MDFNSRNKIKIEGGMASMTDLVFLLLIFFIIMSLMANNQTPIDLPKTEEALPTDTNPVELIIVITEDNLYQINGKEKEKGLTFEQIKPIIVSEMKVQFEKSGKEDLKIAGHKNADYQAVFKVLALAQVNEWNPVLAYDK
tara:strand:- start:135 stop:554 length:420 start_codon:yes stop_codon:yes gene_type:complete